MKRRQFSNDRVHWVDAAPEFQGPVGTANPMHLYERVVEVQTMKQRGRQ